MNKPTDLVESVFAAHNADTECSCSICNIVRMCNRMAETTERTHDLISRFAVSSR